MSMSRKEEIYSVLRSSIGTGELVVLHSALVPLALRPQGLEEDMLGALRCLIDDGKTLALLSFTFSFCSSGWFHYALSPPESGVLASWFMELPEAHRTRHPVYSFVVAGPLAESLTETRDDEAFGAGTIFEVFDERNARIVMLGSSWQWCTQIHRYEELSSVPYRHRMFFTGTAHYSAGAVEACPRLYVRDSELGSQLNFSRIFERARAKGVISTGELGRGRVEAVSAAELRPICLQLLAEDPFAVLDAPREIERRVASRRYLGSAERPTGFAEVTSWTRGT
jgi:aminoglycoside N3'-acetyltransferase